MSKYGTFSINKATFLDEYETWTDFVNRADSEIPKDVSGPMASSQDSRSTSGFHGDWSGARNWAQALDMARNGWPQGRARIEQISSAVFAKTGSLIRKDDIRYDVTGSAVDIGAYLSGQPECFTVWEETDEYREGKGKVVKIVVNAAASSGVTPEVLFLRGACVVALADSLERAGRRVEIHLVMNSSGAEYRVLIKRADQPVQLDQLAFSIASPAAFRRVGFAVMERWPSEVQSQVGYSYGMPHTSEMQGDIILPSAGYSDIQWSNEANAIKWVIDNLKEQGIIIPED